jgi:uncharacterized membrane protein
VTNPGHMGTNRLESFSDGVMAVAITLLVLGVAVPELHSRESLVHALGEEWPQYFAYVVSFITIGIIWINHHAMISRLRDADHTILMLNIVLLMTISALPFATDLLATYLRRPTDQTTAAAVYAGCYGAMAATFSLENWYILMRRTHLIDPPLDLSERRRILHQATLGVVPFVLATGLAFVSPYVTLGICAALDLWYASPLGYGGGRRPRDVSDE